MISFGHGIHGQKLLIAWRDLPRPPMLGRSDPLRFSTARDARDVLRRLAAEPGNLTLLHRLHAEESSTPVFDKDALLDLLAARLAAGHLKARVVTPPPVHVRDVRDPAAGDRAPGKAPTAEPRDTPIVPIEYIILARRESGETVDDTRKLNAKLAELAFLGFSRDTPPSEVARHYPDVAESEQLRVAKAAFDLEMKVQDTRYLGFDKTRPPPDVAPAYVKTADQERGRVSMQAGLFAHRLGALLFDRHDANRERSVTMVEYPAVARVGGENLSQSTALLGDSVGRLRYEPTIQNRSSSTLAEGVLSVAESHGQQTGVVASRFTASLSKLVFDRGSEEDRAPSILAEGVRSLAESHGAQTNVISKRFNEGLSELLFSGVFNARARKGAAGAPADGAESPDGAPTGE